MVHMMGQAVRGSGDFGRRSLLAAATGALACRSRAGAPAAAPAGDPAAPWGGLEVAQAGPRGGEQRGGTAVVLLHGWGAPGDDLVSLGEVLAHPDARFFFPVAPLPERGGGRAWWHLDAADRPAHVGDGEPPPGHRPHRQVIATRTAIQGVLRTIRARHAPTRLVLGGFSQGAMLSLDVALAADPPVDAVVALSGVLLVDSLPALRAPRPVRVPAFVSHGRGDPILAFRGGERIKALLEQHGHPVTWLPFEGGHEIPPEVLAALRGFLFPR